MNALIIIAFCAGGSLACFTLAVILGSGKAQRQQRTACEVLPFRPKNKRLDIRA